MGWVDASIWIEEREEMLSAQPSRRAPAMPRVDTRPRCVACTRPFTDDAGRHRVCSTCRRARRLLREGV